jgi:probable H4MPT-linked C1 transfer pathway protein
MTYIDHSVSGWDIGGANVKAVRLECRGQKIKAHRTAVRPFEIWREPDNLIMVLRDIAEELGMQGRQNVAVTMTAELSDVFRTKREGVLFVLDAIKKAFSKTPIYLFNLEGRFFRLDEARKNPLQCAATNWLASALFIAGHHPDCILMDIGSTTTDIIPIRGGKVISRGRDDTQRLTSGELVYTGVLRTNPNTIVNQVPVAGRPCRVAAEYFTCMADVYLVLGQIAPEGYTCPTADGKVKTIPAARDRIARLVCCDSEIMSAEEIDALARYLWEKQLQQIVDPLFQVLSGLQGGFGLPLAVVGSGRFLAKEAARRLGIQTVKSGRQWGDSTLASFPALAVAYLLAEELTKEVN